MHRTPDGQEFDVAFVENQFTGHTCYPKTAFLESFLFHATICSLPSFLDEPGDLRDLSPDYRTESTAQTPQNTDRMNTVANQDITSLHANLVQTVHLMSGKPCRCHTILMITY